MVSNVGEICNKLLEQGVPKEELKSLSSRAGLFHIPGTRASKIGRAVGASLMALYSGICFAALGAVPGFMFDGGNPGKGMIISSSLCALWAMAGSVSQYFGNEYTEEECILSVQSTERDFYSLLQENYGHLVET